MNKMFQLEVRLFGSFSARWSDGEIVSITSAKQRALLASLITARNGTHSRDWLQQLLWSYGDREQGRMNLRRALFGLRKCLGKRADQLIDANYADIRIIPEHVRIIGDRRDGEFLEGLHIAERRFTKWLADHREHGVSQNIRTPDQASPQNTSAIAPTIAVLPLQVICGGDQHGLLGDLISMELLRALSRSKLLRVISHLASREHRSQNMTLSLIRDQLKVDFVAIGLLRVEQNKFVADIELADCADGTMIWQTSVTAPVAPLLNGSSDILADIATQIGFALINAAVEIAQTRPMPSVDSHRLLMSAIHNMHSDQLRNFAHARTCLEHLIDDRAIEDSRLYAWLAQWYMLSIPQGWTDDPQRDVTRANDCVARGLDINPNCSFSLAISGMVNNSPGHDLDKASRHLVRARQVDPNNAMACLLQARLLAFKGQGAEAVRHANHAMTLSPGGPQSYFFENIAATAHVADGRYAQAIQLINQSLRKNAHHRSSLRVKAVAHELSGDRNTAIATVEKLRTLDPDLSVSSYRASHPAGDTPNGHEWASALARAGLPT